MLAGNITGQKCAGTKICGESDPSKNTWKEITPCQGGARGGFLFQKEKVPSYTSLFLFCNSLHLQTRLMLLWWGAYSILPLFCCSVFLTSTQSVSRVENLIYGGIWGSNLASGARTVAVNTSPPQQHLLVYFIQHIKLFFPSGGQESLADTCKRNANTRQIDLTY